MIKQFEEISHFPCGAFLSPDQECLWRVWAPSSRELKIVLIDDQQQRSVHRMTSTGDGYFVFEAGLILEGQQYLFRLDSGRELPDPVSRWQPDGVDAPSAVWNPDSFEWTDHEWRGVQRENLVFCELHVGTFSPQQSFAGILPRLRQLRELGVTAIQLMPVAQFPGEGVGVMMACTGMPSRIPMVARASFSI